MRNDLQLIRMSLGDPDFNDLHRQEDREIGPYFRCYRVSLRGHRYRGFPDEWQFAMHSQPENRITPALRDEILDEARVLIKTSFPSDFSEGSVRGSQAGREAGVHGAPWGPRAARRYHPLVFVSDNQDVMLSDALRYRDKMVFFIDAPRLQPNPSQEGQSLRFTPLVAAVRNKLNNDELSKLLFVPYEEPGQPATGWRFFGRRSEVDKLVNTATNYFVLGVRRIGKTSLLHEAARRLKKQGRNVIFVPCQNRHNPAEVIDALLRELDASKLYQVTRRGIQITEHLGDTLLSNVLRQLVRDHPGTVLIFDEIGNAITKNPKDDWVFAGTLRDYSQAYDLRIIMSGWQEFTLKWGEFEGPFVNFGSIIRLRGFVNAEVEEFVVDALSAWGQVRDKDALRRLVTSNVGRHPFLLRYFGFALFNRLLDGRTQGTDVLELAKNLLTDQLQSTFAEAVQEVFYLNMPSRLLRYLFLRRCSEVVKEQKRLTEADISEGWIGEVLAELGYRRNMDQQRSILEQLEMHGLAEPSDQQQLRNRYSIVAPVIYNCIDQMYGVENELELLRSEIQDNPEPWPQPSGVTHVGAF